MIKTRFALAASALTIALAGCGASTATTASVNSAAAASGSTAAVGATTPTAGNAPSGNRPQMQTVTGRAADKASAAALAKYPGTVQRVTKMGTSYVVDVTTTAGATKHVAVSATYAVTGLMTPPSGGAPGGTPPSGVQPKTGGTSATTPAVAAATS